MRRVCFLFIAIVIALPLLGSEGNPSKRQRELILKLQELTRGNEAARSMVDAMLFQMEKQFVANAEAKGNAPEAVQEARDLFADFRDEASKIDFADVMSEATVRIYVKYFTEKELEDLIAFYSTTTGKKSIDVLPALMREAAEAGAQSIGPLIDAAMNRAVEKNEKAHPWRKTMADIRSIATAVEAWSLDNGEQYPTGDYASLDALLTPDYIETMPEKDMWDTPFAYVASPDGRHYRIVSAGADSNFEWDSRRITVTETGDAGELRYRDRLEDDIIFADGSFLQLPVHAKPKSTSEE